MAKIRAHLSRAPIREALIDIALEPAISLDAVANAVNALAPRFLQKTDIWQASFGIEFGKEGARSEAKTPGKLGVRLDSKDPPHVLQCRVNGLTFSRLTPYETWEQLRDAARACWGHYAPAFVRSKIKRIAVRYINALRLPLPIGDFGDLLTASPQLPDELPQGVSNFLHRVSFGNAEGPYLATVTQALETVTPGQDITVLLDIEVVRNVDMPPLSDELWPILDTLRDAKNSIFFSHLTERAVDLFQ